MSGGVDRRTFLRRAGLVAGGAVAAGGLTAACSSGKSPTTTFDSVIDHPAKESGIDTVVVLTLENRSFDHMLGWLGTDEQYLDAGRRRYGSQFRVDGRQDLHYTDPRGTTLATSLLTTNGLQPDPFRGCTHPIPGHGWNSGRAQLAHGFLGAGTGNDEYAIGFYDGDDVPFTRELARRFTVFDHWHAPLMAGTFPNRQYLHSGTSDGRKEDPSPYASASSGVRRSGTDSAPPTFPRATTTTICRSSRCGAAAWTAGDRRSPTTSRTRPRGTSPTS